MSCASVHAPFLNHPSPGLAMAGKKKKTSKQRPKGKAPQNNNNADFDADIDEAIMAEVLKGSKETASHAGIATVDESVLSSAIEASLLDRQAPASLDPTFTDEDTLALQDQQFGVEKCPHSKDAVKVAVFRKCIADQKDWDHCDICLALQAKFRTMPMNTHPLMAMLQNEFSAEALPANALWICLTCGEINCGRTLKKHAVAHGRDPAHPLAMNLATLDCWCYECDDQLLTTKGRNSVVQECHSALSKVLQVKQAKARAASEARAKNSRGGAIVAGTLAKSKVHAPGLQNLGNTCFFNSVVQVLTETKSLQTIFSESGRTAFPPSLSISRDKGLGPLTTTFKDFLLTMWKQQGGIVTPRDLFTQIAKKWKVFRGFQEQDSQELMRHLLDGIRQEELDLVKKQAGATSSNDSNDSNASSSQKYAPFIDSCFSGKLVSVIVCDACKKCSYAYEDYYDLSLSVKGPPEPAVSEGGSLMDRLVARSKLASSNGIPAPDNNNSYGISKEDQGSEAHLRHVEKLLKTVPMQSSSRILSIERSLNQFTSVDALDGDNKFACENCYKLSKDGRITPIPEHGEATNRAAGDSAIKDGETLAEEKEATTEAESTTDTNDGQKADPKHVLRRAYKRYLVSSLPPTLVLHLKRFEQSSSRFGMMRKIEDEVDIPAELDMAPYCIPKSEVEEEDIPEVQDQDSKVKALAVTETEDGKPVSTKYRLYGATVHQGSMASGHYSNYVLSSKVEVPPAPEKDKSLPPTAVTAANGQVLPDVPLSALLAQQPKKKNKKGGKKSGGGNSQASQAGGTAAANEPAVALGAAEDKKEEDPRQWIHCSDTNVRLATLDEVLDSRPYLLYYERC